MKQSTVSARARGSLTRASRRFGGYLVIGFILVAGAFALGGAVHKAANAADMMELSAALGSDITPKVFTAAEKQAHWESRNRVATYTVTGAGCAEANGPYQKDGESGGWPSYRNAAGYKMLFSPDHNSWMIAAPGARRGEWMYYGQASATDVWRTMAGTAPAPKVTE